MLARNRTFAWMPSLRSSVRNAASSAAVNWRNRKGVVIPQILARKYLGEPRYDPKSEARRDQAFWAPYYGYYGHPSLQTKEG